LPLLTLREWPDRGVAGAPWEAAVADVFISYAREDQHFAQHVARHLGEHGWSVWWDRELVPGNQFDEVIERELAGAASVVVIWSAVSVRSPWVRSEASAAVDRGVLIPVLAERTEVPLRFRSVQAVDLTGWDLRGDDARLERLVVGVTALAGQPMPPGQPLPPPVAESRPLPHLSHEVDADHDDRDHRRPSRVLLGAAALAAALAAVGVVALTRSGDPDGSSSASSATTVESSTEAPSSTTGTTTTTLPQPDDRLDPGERLNTGDMITSADGRHTLTMTDDGFLVAATDGDEWWTQPKPWEPGASAVMQYDGNFVVYPSLSSDEGLWSTQTHGHDGAYLLIDDDDGEGLLTVRDPDRRALWQRPEPQPAAVEVPDVRGLPLVDAAAELERVGLHSDVVEKSDFTVVEGHVISTDPGPGRAVEEGSTVTVVVSSSSELVEVPNVVGMAEGEAVSTLESVGFATGVQLVEVPFGSAQSGVVLDQKPPSGALVPLGATVDISVGTEAAPVP
jgi:TIR domain/PASTA domain